MFGSFWRKFKKSKSRKTSDLRGKIRPLLENLEDRVTPAVLFSDNFNRADATKFNLGSTNNGLGGAGTHYYLPVFPFGGTDPGNPIGASIVSNALQNNGLDYGGVQLTTNSNTVSAFGENVGQSFNISADLYVPKDASGHVTEAGLYFRGRSAFTGDGIIGGASSGFWVQLRSTGEVVVKKLGGTVAYTDPVSAVPYSFDSTQFHNLQVSFVNSNLQVALDNKLITFSQYGSTTTTVDVPYLGGSNDGTIGIAFSSELNRGTIGGQRADNFVVSTYSSLNALPVENDFTRDWGDAPNPYPTGANLNGASHNATGPMLGTTRDIEGNGQPSAAADGDGSDEDGVFMPASLPPGGNTTINVQVTGGSGFLDAWLDLNGDGDWNDVGEQILTSRPVVAGANTITFYVYSSPFSGHLGQTYARFRLSSTGGLTSTGPASDGEVEDYKVNLGAFSIGVVSGPGGTNPTGNNDSAIEGFTLSGNGQYAAFSSFSTDLVVGDTNDANDVFRKNLTTGLVERVNVSANGTQSSFQSDSHVTGISADGRYVLFESNAANLVPGDTNNKYDIFVKDMQSGAIVRANTNAIGTQSVDGFTRTYSSISGDGHFVAFASEATDLVPGAGGSYWDVFVKNLQTGAIVRASQTNAGVGSNSYSYYTSLSSDGRYLAFGSEGSNLVPGDTNGVLDIFLKDLVTGNISLVSNSSLGVFGNDASSEPKISGDGRYVAFTSQANNLATGDVNAFSDVYVKDTLTGATQLASKNASGVGGNLDSYAPTISSDGRFVGFASMATDLVTGDANGNVDYFVRDLILQSTIRVSVSPLGAEGNGDAIAGSISSDGSYVIFSSSATNMVSGDINGGYDIFIRALAPWFQAGPNQTVVQDSGPQTVSPWVSNYLYFPGAHYVIQSNSNASLFSSGPAVDPTGVLTYTTANGAVGVATLTLTRVDGTLPYNVSQPETFTITVTPSGPANVAPTGTNKTITLLEDTPYSFATGDFGFNDSADSSPDNLLNVKITTVPGAGNLTLSGSLVSAGQLIPAASLSLLTFNPLADGNGAPYTTFTFQVQDDGGTSGSGNLDPVPKTMTMNVTAVNDAPSFVKGANQTVLEDAPLQNVANWATTISKGPADESSQTLTFSVTGNTNPGLFSVAPTVAANGTLTFQPTPNASGLATITLILQDDGGTLNGGANTSVSQTFTINVTAVNDAPSFTKGANQTVLEDNGAATVSNWATTLSAGPSDESGQALNFIVSNDNNALFAVQPAIAANGTLTFTPAPNANGVANVTVQIHDNGGTANSGVDTSANQTFTINVTAVNDAPSFTKGANQTVLEDSGAASVGNWATTLSAGPSDESGQAINFFVSNDNNALFSVQPAIAANGTLTYTPAPNANGVANVTVQIHDNGGTANSGVDTSAIQTFTINVSAVNDAPSFTKGANQTVLEDSGAATVSNWATTLSAGPSDESGQVLNFIVSNDNNALFSVQPAIAANGTLTYTPAPNANGVANVTVQIHDNGGTANSGVDTSANQTFTINVTAVNDVPSFTKGANQTVLEDSGAATVSNWATTISAGPSDESSQALNFIVSNDNNALFSVQPAIAANGTLTFTPAPNANGVANVTVQIHDNGGTANSGVDTSASQTFTINVTAVNDAPSFTKGANQTVLEDSGAATVSNWATALSAGPSDESGQALNFIVSNDNNALFSVQPAIAANGTLTYTPAPNANGVANVTVQIHDNGGTANSGVDTSANQTFTINVTAVNDAPSFTKGANQTVLEDSGAVTVSNWATTISAGPSDESSQALNFIVSNDNTALFSVQPAIAANGTLTFTPAPNASGVANVTVQIHDNGGTANSGVDTSASQTFTFNVTAVNDVPSFTKGPNQTVLEDSGAASVGNWATTISAGPSDESGQAINFIVSNDNNALFAVQPAIAANGTLTYTPAPNANGVANVTVQIHDNGGTANSGVDTSANQTFTINVTAVNDVPTFTKGANQTVLEDSGAASVGNWATTLSAGPSDESGQVLNFIVSNDNNALFSVQPAIAANGTLTFTPAPNANGLANVTVQIHDNGGTANSGVDTSANQTFTINVTAVNDAPSFTKGANQTVLEDAGLQTVAGWATAISKGPADESGQALTFSVTGNTNPGLFSVAPSVAANGTLTFQAAPDANGNATITILLQDDGGTLNGGANASVSQSFTIIVKPVNDAPSFVRGSDLFNLEDDDAQTVPGWATTISKGPANESGQNLTFVISGVTNPGLFTVTPAIAANGTLTYTLAPNASGSSNFTIRLDDDGGDDDGGSHSSASQNCTITVSAVNHAPSFTKGANQTVLEDAGLQTVTNWATSISAGPNESSQTVAFQVTGNTNPGLFLTAPSISSNGTLTYQTAPDANGNATITIILTDNGGTANGGSNTSAPQTFSISVTPVNDAPSFTKGPNQTVLEDAGLQTVNGWATSLSRGPADESGQTLSFSITGNTNPSLFQSGPSISSNGTLTFTPAADANGVATITVVLRDDGGTLNGGANTSLSQSFTINVTPVNDAPSFTKGANQTVLEDAGPQAVSSWATALSKGPTNEASQSLTFSVTGNTNPGLFLSGPSISPNGTLTYTPAADANGQATITVILQDDGDSANGGSNTSVSQSFTINVTPVNDAPSFTKGANQTVLEDAGAQTVNGWATAISAGPANEATQNVTFSITGNTNPSLFLTAPSLSPNGTLTYQIAPDANGVATITVVLKDDGGTLNGGSNTSISQSFTINVTPVNDAPSFTKGANQTVLEDAGLQTVSGWATAISKGPADESGQTLSFSVTGNTNPSLFSVAPSVAANGTLTYTPAPDANGIATITLVLQDDGGTANSGANTSLSQSFTISVTAVNDAPSFVKGANQTVLEDAGLQTVNGWATTLSKGPADEGTQNLTFSVTGNTNPGLFSSGPALSPNGTLTYTPAADANGQATITVVLRDDGGTANGGANTSVSQTFTINVTPVNDAPSFTKGPDQTVSEDSGAQSIAGWASAISAGPNEATQTVNFQVTGNSNTSLFAVQPAVSANGTLTFTPAPNASGSANITLLMQDNGGTANGGSNATAPFSFNINVVPVNDPPSVTLANGTLSYVENDGARILDSGFVVADIDSTNLVGATLTFTANYASGQDLLTFVDQNGINGTFNATTGTLTLSGSSSLANYQTALRSITYTNNSEAPSTANRTLSLVVNDGAGANNLSTAVTRTITVTAVNDAPVIATTASNLTYQQGSAPFIDTGFTVTDVDSPNLSGANVAFSAGFSAGQDLLGFTNQNGITGSYNGATGILTLSGSSSVANYQAALRSVTYSNSSPTPSIAPRTIRFQANDGAASNNLSNVASRTLTVNAAPNLAPIANQTITVYNSNVSLSATDPNNDPLTFGVSYQSVGYYLRTTLGLTVNSAKNNYGGQQEKWFMGTGGIQYFIMPDGRFYRWDGTVNSASGTLQTTINTIYYTNVNLISTETQNGYNVTLSIINGNVINFSNLTGYPGQLYVTATVSDGFLSDSESFYATVINLPPVLDPIADQFIPIGTDFITVPLHATDPENDPITYSAVVTSQAQTLNQQLSLIGTAPRPTYVADYNNRIGEKWLYALDPNKPSTQPPADYLWYYILPNGDLFLWDKTPYISKGTFIANVGSYVYNNPSTLLSNAPTSVTVTVTGNQVKIDPTAGYLGNVTITAKATDIVGNFDTKTFTVNIGGRHPILTQPADYTISRNQSLTIPLVATDPDGLPISFRVTSEAMKIKGTYGLGYTAQRYTNGVVQSAVARWMTGAGSGVYFYILPDGSLYRYDQRATNMALASTLVATIDPRYYQNTYLLTDANYHPNFAARTGPSTTVAATPLPGVTSPWPAATYSIVNNQLVVTPSASFAAIIAALGAPQKIVVIVDADNGVYVDTKTFTITVT